MSGTRNLPHPEEKPAEAKPAVVKPAEARTIDLLVASGVSYETWNPPLELSEPRGFGAPISHDELIDFHDFLQDERRVWDALATTPGRST